MTVLSFDEINALVSTSYTLSSGDANAVTGDISSLLINAYERGFRETVKKLEQDIELELEDLYLAFYRETEGKTFLDRVEAHIEVGDLDALVRLTETEVQRMFNTGAQDGAEAVEDMSGQTPQKTWATMTDERVRDTHRDLEGVSIGLHERFYTSDGDSALYPGGFASASNNVGCRCVLVYSM